MNLPKSLLHWSEQLDIFPIESSTALGPMIQRLAAAIGPLRVSHVPGSGDPDGFHGITRRGDYERLLLSEWLLADELPDEFIRRAAMGEHVFFEIERKEPFSTKRSIALFDSGPDQLGRCRIAQLAILIVLSRRAANGGARFHWGILQAREPNLVGEVSTTSVQALLDSRTSSTPDETGLDRWRILIDSTGAADDFWLIGGPKCAELAESRKLSLLQIAEVLEPDERRLVAAIGRIGRADREIVLELPDDRQCARLIRDPFATALAPRIAGAPANDSGLIFTQSGSKLLALSGEDKLLAFPVPNSPKAAPGQPKAYGLQRSGRLVAACRHRKGIFGAALRPDDSTVLVRCLGGKCNSILEEIYHFEDPYELLSSVEGTQLGFCHLMEPVWNDDPKWLVQAGQMLLRLTRATGDVARDQGTAQVEAHVIAAVSRTKAGVVYLAQRSDAWALVSLGDDGHRRTHKRFPNVEAAYFGFGGSSAHARFGLLAINNGSNQWAIFYEDGVSVVSGEVGRVAGTIWFQNAPALVVIEPDNRTIWAVAHDSQERITRAHSAITNLCVSTVLPQIAYTMQDGSLEVYSLWHNAPVLQYRGQDA